MYLCAATDGGAQTGAAAAVTGAGTGFPTAGVIASFKPYDVGAGK